jgi:hypothetical protein
MMVACSGVPSRRLRSKVHTPSDSPLHPVHSVWVIDVHAVNSIRECVTCLMLLFCFDMPGTSEHTDHGMPATYQVRCLVPTFMSSPLTAHP